VWSQSGADGRRGHTSFGYRLSAASTLINHLYNCEFQTETVKQRALHDDACTLSEAKKLRTMQANPGPAAINANPPYGGHSPAIDHPLPFSSSSSSAGLFPGPTDNFQNALQLEIPYLSTPGSTISSLRPEDSVSTVSGASSGSYPHISSISRPPSRLSGLPRVGSGHILWTGSSQSEFEDHIARITVSANLPLAWVDNIETVSFFDKYFPAATGPTRKVLTTRIIPRLVEELEEAARKEARGKNATVQADGWTGANHRHLIAFMITAERKVCV